MMKSKIYYCYYCGQECAIDEHDVSNHITDDGIDYDADADHVALPDLMETDPMKWKYTIDVKDEWDRTKKYGDEVPRVELKKLVDLVNKLIRRIPESLLTWNLLDALDLLEESVEDNGEEFADLEIFNEGWNQLYDWADYNRVWIKTII